MSQFRITRKFAADCHIKSLYEPAITLFALDDWFVDCVTLNRRKYAMLTHGQTALTFMIAYSEAGGAKNIPTYFKKVLIDYFKQQNLLSLIPEVENIFRGAAMFTKTVDRKVLGHMNDFKHCAAAYVEKRATVDSMKLAKYINQVPMKVEKNFYASPFENFNSVFNCNLPKQPSRLLSSD